MSEKSVKNKSPEHFRGILIGMAVCAVACSAAYGTWKFAGKSTMFVVKNIEIKNTKKADSADVLALSGIKPGMRMQDCNTAASEKAIGSLPWVRKVCVTRQYPSTVHIVVEERIPIAIAACGQVHLIDKSGTLLPFSSNTPLDLPVVTGMKAGVKGNSVDSADMALFTHFLSDASQCSPILLQQISQIDFSGRPMLKLKLANSTMLMELNSSEERVGLMRLEKLLDIVSHSSQTQPQKLNVCFSNMAYAQW